MSQPSVGTSPDVIVDVHGEVRTDARRGNHRTWGGVAGYRRVFGGRDAEGAGHASGHGSADQDVADIESLGAISILHAKQPSGISGTWDDAAANDDLAAAVSRSPRLRGLAALDASKDVSVELDRALSMDGIIGAKLNTVWYGLPSDDPTFFPTYEACQARGVPIWVHTCNNWDSASPMDLSHPRRLDRVAARFPDLTLIAGHGGWPWVLDTCVVAWRHANVYIDLSAHRFRHFGKPGSGWEPLFLYGSSVIRDRVLFGTAWDVVGVPFRDMLLEFRDLPLSPEVARAWLGGNAVRALGLDVPSGTPTSEPRED